MLYVLGCPNLSHMRVHECYCVHCVSYLVCIYVVYHYYTVMIIKLV